MLRIGQIWRDQDGANWRIVALGDNGWPWIRTASGNTSTAILTNPAWFEVWTLTTDV